MTIRPYLDHTPVIGQGSYIDPQSAVIGKVTIGEHVSIWPCVVIRGDVSHVTIGDRTNIQDGSVLHVTGHTDFNDSDIPLIIGADVTVGHKAMLHACTIEDETLIGMNAVVLDGAYIESQVLVAAGSVVPPGKRLVSGYVYRGNPVVQARKLKDSEIAYFRYSCQHYMDLKDQYLQST